MVSIEWETIDSYSAGITSAFRRRDLGIVAFSAQGFELAIPEELGIIVVRDSMVRHLRHPDNSLPQATFAQDMLFALRF